MKLVMNEQAGLADTEVEIRYAELNDDVKDLARHIEQYDCFICGMDNGRQYRTRVNDIYYIESVDRKTFIYTRNEVFRSELRLYQFLDKVKGFDFVQVSKACIVNMNVIDGLQSLANSRLQATLINGEKINISRTFLTQIKLAFMGKEDELW